MYTKTHTQALTQAPSINNSSLSRRSFLGGSAAALAALALLKQRAFAEAAPLGSLKKSFEKDFLMGTMVSAENCIRDEAPIRKIIQDNFNALSAENVFKWEYIHPTERDWAWSEADAVVDFAEKYQLQLNGHVLVWHAQNPSSLFYSTEEKRITRESLLKKMQDHIHTLVDRYKGRVHSWDVVNEALAQQGAYTDNSWHKIIGEDYVEQAFYAAREAEPTATLLYNDYGLSTPAKRDGLLAMIAQLQKKQVPIDAIGLQGHFGLEYPQLDELERTIEAIAKTGLRIHISEMEIDVLPPLPEGAFADYKAELDPYKNGLPEKISQQLAQRYRELFSLFSKHREHIDRVTLWGIGDGDSWKNNFPIEGRSNHPLLFDRDYQPKAAYQALLDLKAQT